MIWWIKIRISKIIKIYFVYQTINIDLILINIFEDFVTFEEIQIFFS